MAFRGDFYRQCPTCHLNQPAPDRQGLCRQLCQVAAFLPCSPGWPEAPSWWHGHPLLAATSLGGQSWQHGVMSSPLLGRRATRTPLQSPGGFMQLTVDQMGTCHCDTVGQTCCKPKSPEPLGWGLKLDCGHTVLPSTTVNPAACVAGRLGTPDRHGNEQWDVRGCDLPPRPPVTGKVEINANIFSGGWRLTESSLLFSWLFIFKSIMVEISQLYALTLIKTWCEILVRKTQINFMFTIALWKERKRKREREKQPDFWFWK